VLLIIGITWAAVCGLTLVLCAAAGRADRRYDAAAAARVTEIAAALPHVVSTERRCGGDRRTSFRGGRRVGDAPALVRIA
jgi:hypothetical protein